MENLGGTAQLDANVLDELLRNFHSIKGLSAMVGVEEATQLAHRIEDYLRDLKPSQTVPSAQGIERILGGIDAIERVVAARRTGEPAPDITETLLQLDVANEEPPRPVPESVQARPVRNWRFVFRPSPQLAEDGITVGTVRDLLKSIGQVLHAAPVVSAEGRIAFDFVVATDAPESSFAKLRSQGIEYSSVYEQPRTPVPQTPAAPAPGPTNVIRVDMSRLDELMRLVGELVITRFRLGEVLRLDPQTNSGNNWRTLQEISGSMERQLRELREGVMRVRMVSVGQVFERMRFVVRGLEREAGKRIEVHIEGQETEIDKAIVDRMMDPLLHLVRNAVSHGLETPDERIAAGKPGTGNVRLTASTLGDTVLIVVEDDGKGIDIERIRVRARARNLLGPEEQLDPKRVMDVICAPGFTTRDDADLASGRGVGMAAVRSVVNELGGSIALQTEAGKGSRFEIRLPLTLLIADSLMVKVADQQFAVPQTAVREVLAIESSAVKVFEHNEIVPFRGGVLPILRLGKFFGLEGRTPPRIHLLVVADGGKSIGLAVDRITGQRQIVIRAITDPLSKTPGVVGATELGDGRPVLILDPHSMIRAARDGAVEVRI
jgi:two-component system chemotaxis sensor kinase CheA